MTDDIIFNLGVKNENARKALARLAANVKELKKNADSAALGLQRMGGNLNNKRTEEQVTRILKLAAAYERAERRMRGVAKVLADIEKRQNRKSVHTKGNPLGLSVEETLDRARNLPRQKARKVLRAIRERSQKEFEEEKRVETEEKADARRNNLFNRINNFGRRRGPIEKKSGGRGGGRGGPGFGGGNSKFANRALVAGGALSALTGNFGFLGIGFAGMSGGPGGAAAVGVATAVGAIIRAGKAFEDTIQSLSGKMELLSGSVQAQVTAYTKSIERIETGVALLALGDRNSASTSFRTSSSLSTIFGMMGSNAMNGLIDSLSRMDNILGVVVRSLTRFSETMENTAMLQESVAIMQEKRMRPIREQFQELGFSEIEHDKENNRLNIRRTNTLSASNNVRAQMDKPFALQQEQRRIAGLVDSGNLDRDVAAKFLAKNKPKILDKEFRSGFVGLEELSRKIQTSAASTADKEPSVRDIKEQTTAIVSALKDIKDETEALARKFPDEVIGVRGSEPPTVHTR